MSGGFAAFADGPDDQALAAALELYAQIVNKYPEDPLSQLAQVRIAECKMRLGKLEEASKLLEAFIQADPLGAYRGQAHVLWGDLYLEYYFDGHRAEVEYNAVFDPEGYAKSLKLLYRVAGKPFFAPDMTGDISLMRVSTDGTDPLAAEARAAADTASQEALKTSELPAGVDPSWKEALADAHTRLGILAYMRNNLKEADAQFTKSYAEAPDEGRGPGVPSGVILLAEKCREKLSPVPRYVMQAGGERARIALFLAACYEDCGQLARAANVFKRVAGGEFPQASADQRGFALSRYGESLWYSGDGEGALAAWQEFLQPPLNQTTDAPDALFCYAASLFTVTQDPKSLDYLVRVYTAYPQSASAPRAMVEYAAAIRRTDPKKARDIFIECQRRYPNGPNKTQIPGLISQCLQFESKLAADKGGKP